MSDALRFLILNAYPREGRAALAGVGATDPGVLYARILREWLPQIEVDHLSPADADARLPEGVSLSDYAGIVWTGSSLTIHADDDERVQRQITLARAAYDAGTPSFGSCWAAQIAVTAAGGACARNPRGREFGVSREIELTEAGVQHPLFADKPRRFDAFTSHADEIVRLPPHATCLAGNAFSRIQAVAVEHGRASFWAVQYHPEYDFHEVARLSVLRAPELIAQGTLADEEAAARYTEDLEALHVDATRADLVERLGAGSPALAAPLRHFELRNWLRAQVLPQRAPALLD